MKETEGNHLVGEGTKVCEIVAEGFCLCRERKPELFEKILVSIVLCGGKEIKRKQSVTVIA